MVFPLPVGRQRVAAMGLDEMRAVAEALPGVRETGFYVGGFPGVVNYGVIPLVYAGMKVAPRRAGRSLGWLLDAIRQVLADPRPGVHLQAMLVEPIAFFADLARMGIDVWAQPPSTPYGHPA